MGRKQKYVNDLAEHIEFFKAKLSSGVTHVWHLGQARSKSEVLEIIAELEADIKKIANDPSFKPWNDYE